MKTKTFFCVVLAFMLLSGGALSSCATLKHRDVKEDMIMYMMLKDVSAMNKNSNELDFMQNQ